MRSSMPSTAARPPLARSSRACKHCASTSPRWPASGRGPGRPSSAERAPRRMARRMTQATPEHEPTVQELFDLTGKVVLLTGGTGHLGPAMARALAEAGAVVVLTGRDQARADAAAAALPRPGDGRHHGPAPDPKRARPLPEALPPPLRPGGP